MPSWPVTLPRPRADGWKEQLAKRFVEFQSDKPGVTKRRAVTTAAPDVLTFTMTVTAAQRAALRDFYFGDCGGGALKFDYTHPVSGAAGKAQFGEEPGFSVRPRTDRFLASVTLKFWG